MNSDITVVSVSNKSEIINWLLFALQQWLARGVRDVSEALKV